MRFYCHFDKANWIREWGEKWLRCASRFALQTQLLQLLHSKLNLTQRKQGEKSHYLQSENVSANCGRQITDRAISRCSERASYPLSFVATHSKPLIPRTLGVSEDFSMISYYLSMAYHLTLLMFTISFLLFSGLGNQGFTFQLSNELYCVANNIARLLEQKELDLAINHSYQNDEVQNWNLICMSSTH